MWNCFFCFSPNAESDIILHDSLEEIKQEYYSDEEDETLVLESLDLKTLYDDSRLLITVFIINGILLSLFFYSITA